MLGIAFHIHRLMERASVIKRTFGSSIPICVWLKRGEAVAFDPDIAAQVLRQAWHTLQSSGLRNQLQAGEAGEGGSEHRNIQRIEGYPL